MSKKRGGRSKSSSSKKFAVSLVVHDEGQLQRTLDLCGVKDERPNINEVVARTADRIERERQAKMLALARSWQNQGWGNAMLYDCMGEDDIVYDPYEEIYDGVMSCNSRKMKKLNKKLFKGKKSRGKKFNLNCSYDDEDDYWNNRASMFRHGEWSDDDLDNEDNYEEGYKSIKFYSDIENELSVREFSSLKDFSDFCGEHNYIMSTTDYNNLLNWSVIHCCLDPISEEYGEHEIITDNSYGGLYWTVSEDVSKHAESCSIDARTFTD